MYMHTWSAEVAHGLMVRGLVLQLGFGLGLGTRNGCFIPFFFLLK